MSRLVFGSFNLSFQPARTRVDWLSRDVAEVDDITLQVYPGGRHEILNETNREAVIDAILA